MFVCWVRMMALDFFFFQAEDGIRDVAVTGVQTCAPPIFGHAEPLRAELQAFVSAIREQREPAVTGEEGVASLEIAIRCLESRTLPSAARRRSGPRRLTG